MNEQRVFDQTNFWSIMGFAISFISFWMERPFMRRRIVMIFDPKKSHPRHFWLNIRTILLISGIASSTHSHSLKP